MKKEGACPADRQDPRGNERETACGCSLRAWALKAKAGRVGGLRRGRKRRRGYGLPSWSSAEGGVRLGRLRWAGVEQVNREGKKGERVGLVPVLA